MDTKRPAFLFLLALVIAASMMVVAFNFIRSKPSSTSDKAVAANVATRAANSSRSLAAPAKFVIYKQGSKYPTSVVVDGNTTDEQLRSLLWLFREKVRVRDFKAVGLTRPTSVTFGKENWNSGMIVIFRGTKCATEDDATPDGDDLADLGPCGKGDHSAATYQWGIGGHVDKDAGTLGPVSSEDGTLVFDYTDGWLPHPEMSVGLDAKEHEREMLEGKRETDKKVFANSMQKRANSQGFADMAIWPISQKELVIDSELLKDNTGRVEFISRVLPGWHNDLCRAGVENVQLQYQFPWQGKRYSLECH